MTKIRLKFFINITVSTCPLNTFFLFKFNVYPFVRLGAEYSVNLNSYTIKNSVSKFFQEVQFRMQTSLPGTGENQKTGIEYLKNGSKKFL